MVKSRIKESSEVDITPMIDIVFQLIIFFMVVMAIAVVYGVAIKFPSGNSNSAEKDKNKQKNVIVYVQADWVDQGHYIRQDGILKLNGKEILLAHTDDRSNWEEERERGYKELEFKMSKLLEETRGNGKKVYNDSLLIVQGEMKTYHGKVMRVIDRAKRLDMESFSLVPPTK